MQIFFNDLNTTLAELSQSTTLLLKEINMLSAKTQREEKSETILQQELISLLKENRKALLSLKKAVSEQYKKSPGQDVSDTSPIPREPSQQKGTHIITKDITRKSKQDVKQLEKETKKAFDEIQKAGDTLFKELLKQAEVSFQGMGREAKGLEEGFKRLGNIMMNALLKISGKAITSVISDIFPASAKIPGTTKDVLPGAATTPPINPGAFSFIAGTPKKNTSQGFHIAGSARQTGSLLTSQDTVPPVVVNITNNSGTPMKATQQQPLFNGREYIVNVVVDNIESNGVLRHYLSKN